MTREEIKKGLISYLDSIQWGIGKYHEVFGSLINMLSLPEKDGWIPVSERLPDDHDWYVIVVKEKSTGYQYIPRIAMHHSDNCWAIIDTENADKEWLDDLECIAWMPLPSPYRADREASE